MVCFSWILIYPMMLINLSKENFNKIGLLLTLSTKNSVKKKKDSFLKINCLRTRSWKLLKNLDRDLLSHLKLERKIIFSIITSYHSTLLCQSGPQLFHHTITLLNIPMILTIFQKWKKNKKMSLLKKK